MPSSWQQPAGAFKTNQTSKSESSGEWCSPRSAWFGAGQNFTQQHVDPHRHQELRNGATRNGGCKALYTGSRISPQWTCLLWHASRLWTGATGRNKELYPRQDLNRSMQSTTRGRLWAKMWCFFLKPRFIWLKFIKYDLLEISST